MARLRWEETDQALALLEAQLARQPDNLRARQDYIVALRQKDRMQEVPGAIRPLSAIWAGNPVLGK